MTRQNPSLAKEEHKLYLSLQSKSKSHQLKSFEHRRKSFFVFEYRTSLGKLKVDHNNGRILSESTHYATLFSRLHWENKGYVSGKNITFAQPTFVSRLVKYRITSEDRRITTICRDLALLMKESHNFINN